MLISLVRHYSRALLLTLTTGLVLALCSCSTLPANFDQSSGVQDKVLHLTDIHFNPFLDKQLIPKLLDQPVDKWEELFQSSAIQTELKANGSDTNYALLASSVAAAAEQKDQYSFAMFTGDFLCHDFRSTAFKYTKNPGKYREFVNKTLEFVCIIFARHLPDTAVYFTLGNNDTYAGDYRLVVSGPFLRTTAPIFAKYLFKTISCRIEFIKSFPAGGCYAITMANNPKIRLIALNSVLFSRKYADPDKHDRVGHKALEWFDQQLGEAFHQRQKAWVIMHIPPGRDTFASVEEKRLIPIWRPEFLPRFEEIIEKHADSIRGIFTGHTHMDHFRVLLTDKEKKPCAFVKIGPSVSPVFGNYPSFTIYRYDRDSLKVRDYAVYNLAPRGPPSSKPTWKREYCFGSTYGESSLSASSLNNLTAELKTGPARLRESYIQFYNSSDKANSNITDANWNQYWESILNWDIPVQY